VAAVVIAEIAIAAVAAAIASGAPPGRFPAEMPHEDEAGGAIQGMMLGESARAAPVWKQRGRDRRTS